MKKIIECCTQSVLFERRWSSGTFYDIMRFLFDLYCFHLVNRMRKEKAILFQMCLWKHLIMVNIFSYAFLHVSLLNLDSRVEFYQLFYKIKTNEFHSTLLTILKHFPFFSFLPNSLLRFQNWMWIVNICRIDIWSSYKENFHRMIRYMCLVWWWKKYDKKNFYYSNILFTQFSSWFEFVKSLSLDIWSSTNSLNSTLHNIKWKQKIGKLKIREICKV
jgi:hypothetical protein